MNQVIVFYQNGCPACHDYLPRFKRLATPYARKIAIRKLNVNTADKAIQDAAVKFKIRAAPTTIVLSEKDRVLRRVEGAIPDVEITALLERAAL